MENTIIEVFNHYGLKEVEGSKSNKKILKIIKSVVPWANDDSKVAWCAIFATYIFNKCGLAYLIPDNPAGARNWLDLAYSQTVIWQEGDDVNDIKKFARTGDVVIFWRGSKDGWKGHIAWYLNEYDHDTSKIRTIGGNQANGVLIRPYSKSRILKIIRL